MPVSQLRHRVAELRRRRRGLPAVAGLGSTFVLLVLFFTLVCWNLTVWTGLLAFLGVGLMQYRLVLATHEATHKTLLQPVWLNDTVGLFCASLVGVSFFNYRRAHLEHHKAPQSVQDDIDGYIYRPLILARPGWRRFLLLVTGNYADICTKLRRKFFGDSDLPGSHALVGAPRPGLGQVLTQWLPIVGGKLSW